MKPLSSNWREIPAPMPKHQKCWEHKIVPLTVIYSRSIGNYSWEQWHHFSVSRPDRLPTWQELSKVKDEFLGEEIEAYQVLAKRSEHVNVHNFCLHFFAPLSGERKVLNLQDITWEFSE